MNQSTPQADERAKLPLLCCGKRRSREGKEQCGGVAVLFVCVWKGLLFRNRGVFLGQGSVVFGEGTCSLSLVLGLVLFRRAHLLYAGI